MRFCELVNGGAADVAEALHGDDPPDTIPELRAALTNALNRIAQLEKATEISRDGATVIERLAAIEDALDIRR